jgi:hypothetical protein
MDQQIPPEWAHLFEGKTRTEILKTPQPPGLSPMDSTRFERAVYAATSASLAAELKADKERRALEKLASLAAEPAAAAAEPMTAPAPSLPPLVIPQASTDVLLERQIASCAGLIEHIAHYIARHDSAIDACGNFMERMASLMNSSANVAKMVGRLRGSLEPEETRFRQIVEREDRRKPAKRAPSPRSVRQ